MIEAMFPELEAQADRIIQARLVPLFRDREKAAEAIRTDVIARGVARSGVHAQLVRDAFVELFRRHGEEVLSDLMALVESHVELGEASSAWLWEKFSAHIDGLGEGMARTASQLLQPAVHYDGEADFARAAGSIKGEGKLRLDTAAGEAALRKRRAKPAEPPPATPAPLSLEGLHPTVIAVSGKLYRQGDYRQAILDSYIALVQEVKRRTGLAADNTPLMQAAFSSKNPKLVVGEDEDEQMGFMWLFSGAVMGIRNPKAHRLVPQNDPQRALEWLAFASVLFRVLDDAREPEKRNP